MIFKWFHRYYEYDNFDRRSMQRSLSQPSLARSASEFTERWVAPDDGFENISPDGTPRPIRHLREMVIYCNYIFKIWFSMHVFPQRSVQQGDAQQHATTSQSQYVTINSSSHTTGTSSSAPSKDWYTSASKKK